MNIEIDMYWAGGIIAFLLVWFVLRVGILIGRATERRQWVSLADQVPKDFIFTPDGQFTVFSKDEWDQYGIVEISSFREGD